MSPRQLTQLACWALLLATGARAEENLWPLFVIRKDPARQVEAAEYVGPLFFHVQAPGAKSAGFRPLFMTAQTGDAKQGNFLYPFFTWRSKPGVRYFSFFQLVTFRSFDDPGRKPEDHFEIWPVYFSHKANDPADSYTAVFPIAGTLRNRLGKDRWSFVLFPLYLQTEDHNQRVTHTPWPFIRRIDGPGYKGFEFWPLFGQREHTGISKQSFWLWPLGMKTSGKLDQPVPDERFAMIPFYMKETGAGYRSETYVWPFFGYTHRTEPYVYNERRYLWPFLVQGRGDNRYVNRWGPFYTYSNIKGRQKTWYFWPLVRSQRWEDDGLRHEKDTLFYFVYSSLTQRSVSNPAAAPARRVHVWPLYSSWADGTGREQVQMLSPFDVFFPFNETVRQLWTPLFSLYRYERTADAATRHSFLWNAITSRKTATSSEFHLGPLFSNDRTGDQRRVAFLSGVFGMQRTAAGWRPFLFDFRMKAANKADTASTP